MKCTEPLEIERRFLIRRPSEEELRRRSSSSEGRRMRNRRSISSGSVHFIEFLPVHQ